MKRAASPNCAARCVHSSAAMTKKRGFTLIEMLVVMTLIAMLLTLAVPRYFGSLEKSRVRVQQQNVATIRDAIDKFKADQDRYPESLEELVGRKYLRQIPLDPVTEAADWVLIAPSDPKLGNVYDIQPAPVPQQPATRER